VAWDEELGAYRLYVVGYLARCGCGFRGKVRRRLNVARADAYLHKVEAHGHRPQ
jgi:hypothetical protein